jgi:hypothetical protein
MINTVLFDMGGTLEDIYSDDASKLSAARGVLRILHSHGGMSGWARMPLSGC